MTERGYTARDLERLREWDTPTICNGLELLVPGSRGGGFTTSPFAIADPRLPPMVGLARVGTIRARHPASGPVATREDWFDYVAAAELPTVVVLQDLDSRPGFGAFWGEVQSTIHQALGALGVVTDGSFRDLGMLAPGFQILGRHVGPSHGHVHLVAFGQSVEIFGMAVAHDDIVHADLHGAVVVPADCVTRLPAAIETVARRERVILEACREPGFSSARLREAMAKARQLD